MNTFRNQLETHVGDVITENGARAFSSTNSACLDLFALGASYRNRSWEDKVTLFKNAYYENREIAVRCLFYIGAIRAGQGERDFFRTCFDFLTYADEKLANRLVRFLPELRRWDDLVYFGINNNSLRETCFDMMARQLNKDIMDMDNNRPVSLLAKWLPSENASSNITRQNARTIIKAWGLPKKSYRKALSRLRKYIKVTERYMSDRLWSKIDYSTVPSVAFNKYKNAFETHDGERFDNFIEDKDAKVNTSVLYPYQIISNIGLYDSFNSYSVEQKQWDNLPDYLNGNKSNTICVVDTSGSMEGRPMDVAFSLGIYFAERNRGPFADSVISFSENPKYITLKGSLVDKVQKLWHSSEVANTNIEKTFDLLLKTALQPNVKKEDIPENVLIISDMEFDEGTDSDFDEYDTLFNNIKEKWAKYGLTMPHCIFWNVDARQNNLPMKDEGNVSFVSGFSPSIFKAIITGKKGYELMMEALANPAFRELTNTIQEYYKD